MTAFSALCDTMENSVTLRHGKNLMENVAEGDRFLVLTFNGKAEEKAHGYNCIQVLVDATE